MNNTNNSNLLVKQQRLTKAERLQFSLTAELKGILVGLLLGDLHISKTYVNPRLAFKQSTIHEEYLLHLYELFKGYSTSAPKLKLEAPDKRTGKVYSATYFYSYSLPCFNSIYNLFYLEGKKIIPANIGFLLTPLGLAYWLCDDGTFCKSTHRVHLCTESFTLAEVNLLVKTINDKWNLKCHKVTRGSGYRIVISRESLPILQSLLKDIMPSMMLHKIGL
jgi:hypothetical protein